MMTSGRQDVSTFLIDPENGAEMVRLSNLHRLLTQYMDGLFPQDINTAPLQRVLDLACGPGDWVQDVAFERQDIDIFGIDSSRSLITHASAMAGVQGLDNASFEVMDIRKQLDFDDNSFDFIQARLLTSILSPAEWPGLLAECQRILRPGGIMRLVEAAWPETNSPAVQHFGRIVIQALRQVGRSYSPDGQQLGTLAVLVPLLRDAGLTQVRSRTHEVPFTTGLVGPHPIMELLRIELYLMEPALLRWEVVTRAEFKALISQMELETFSDSFRGMLRIGEAWGTF
ncbi:MAG TPA: methyltransferase domain-containing protein [Ktedonobacteraceae bacterium]|nr:methyltransferase domain-containing protein [Ktedonobacteraceae bacterium]